MCYLNAFRDIGLSLNIIKKKYMEIESSSGMMTKEYITECSNSYKKMKIFKYSSSFLTNQNSIHEVINVEIKHEIQSIHSSLLDFSLKI